MFMSAVRTPASSPLTASLSPDEIQHAAKGIVISFASVGPNLMEEAAAARSLAVAAGPELLIVGSTTPKSFIHQSSSLAGQAVVKAIVCHDVRVSNRPSCYHDVEEAYRKDNCGSLTAMPVVGAKGEALGAICLGLQQNVNLSSKHLETLRLLTSALGPLLQQFISDTRLYQDTSVFVDEGVAQCMVGGQGESMDTCDSLEADFLQYDLGTYEEFSDDVLNRTSREWDRLMSNTSDQDNPEKMHNCASLDSTCSESLHQGHLFGRQGSVQHTTAN